MKRHFFLLFLLLGFTINAQQKLTLEDCYALVAKNYPIAKQSEMMQQKANFEIEALNKAKLPKIDLNAQATYQSEVTQVPVKIPNSAITPLNKDQYRATLDVNQLLYNGGFIDANSNLKKAQTKTQQQQVAVSLYQLKSKINQYYLSVLLLQERSDLLVSKQNQLDARIKEVKAGVKYGAVLPSSEQVLQAEQLKIKQQLAELSFEKKKMLQDLALLLGTSADENVALQKPQFASEKSITRPELELFQMQTEQLEASKTVITKSQMPKVNAFVQAGYGNPGLNMLDNSFATFYMTGVKLNWNVFDWNKTKKEKQALDIALQLVANEKETFELNTQMQLQELESEIQKTNSLIQSDDEIIVLHENIVKSVEAQLRNGVITSSDYLVELTRLYEAKTNQKVHELQRDLAQANYRVIKGN